MTDKPPKKDRLEIRHIDEKDPEYRLVKALSTQVGVVCSEFDIRHTMSALSDLLGYCLSEVKPEFRDEAMGVIFENIAENRKYHEEKNITVVDEGNSNGPK